MRPGLKVEEFKEITEAINHIEDALEDVEKKAVSIHKLFRDRTVYRYNQWASPFGYDGSWGLKPLVLKAREEATDFIIKEMGWYLMNITIDHCLVHKFDETMARFNAEEIIGHILDMYEDENAAALRSMVQISRSLLPWGDYRGTGCLEKASKLEHLIVGAEKKTVRFRGLDTEVMIPEFGSHTRVLEAFVKLVKVLARGEKASEVEAEVRPETVYKDDTIKSLKVRKSGFISVEFWNEQDCKAVCEELVKEVMGGE